MKCWVWTSCSGGLTLSFGFFCIWAFINRNLSRYTIIQQRSPKVHNVLHYLEATFERFYQDLKKISFAFSRLLQREQCQIRRYRGFFYTHFLSPSFSFPKCTTYLGKFISDQLSIVGKLWENKNPKDRCAIHHFYSSSPSQLHLSIQWWRHQGRPPPHHSPHPAAHWTACWGCCSLTWADKEFKHPLRETVQLVKSPS